MTATLASHILDCIRDHLHLHVGFCQWTRDDGVGDGPGAEIPRGNAGCGGGAFAGGCSEPHAYNSSAGERGRNTLSVAIPCK